MFDFVFGVLFVFLRMCSSEWIELWLKNWILGVLVGVLVVRKVLLRM